MPQSSSLTIPTPPEGEHHGQFGSVPQTTVAPVQPRHRERSGRQLPPTPHLPQYHDAASQNAQPGPSTSRVSCGLQTAYNYGYAPPPSYQDQLAEDLFRSVANGPELPQDDEEEVSTLEGDQGHPQAMTPFQHTILQEILSLIPSDRKSQVSSWLGQIIIRALRTVANPMPSTQLSSQQISQSSSLLPSPSPPSASLQDPTTLDGPLRSPVGAMPSPRLHPIRRDTCVCRCTCGRASRCRCPCTCGRIFDIVDLEPPAPGPRRGGNNLNDVPCHLIGKYVRATSVLLDDALFNFDLYAVCDEPSHRNLKCHEITRLPLPQHSVRPAVEQTLHILNEDSDPE